MRFSCGVVLSVLLPVAIWSGAAQAEDATPRGDLVLPTQALVFGPFAREDGVPASELLARVPETLVIGGKRATGRTATFDSRRCLDCAPFCGTPVGNTAWVYLAFTADAAGPTTFGFGADWWYEAYRDGKLISDTLSHGEQGNVAWPPSIRDFTVTVDVAKGPHVLAVRMLRGSGSAMLAVGGPLDLKNPAIRKAPVSAVASIVEDAQRTGQVLGVRMAVTEGDEDEPWMAPPSRQRPELLLVGPFPQKVTVVLGNQAYVPKDELPPSLVNRLIRLAAFQNPEFYKAQAMRLSTFGRPRIISCAEDYPRHIALPRGCLDEVVDLAKARHHGRSAVLSGDPTRALTGSVCNGLLLVEVEMIDAAL